MLVHKIDDYNTCLDIDAREEAVGPITVFESSLSPITISWLFSDNIPDK